MTCLSRILLSLPLLALTGALAASAQLVEDRLPTGGADITTRKCSGGGNAGALCNEDSDCDSGNCFPYNVVDLTVNLLFSGRMDEPGWPREWNPAPQQLATIQQLFRDANDRLADVTDGQIAFGTISLITDNGAPNAAVQLSAGVCCSDPQRGFPPLATCDVDNPVIFDSECPAGTFLDSAFGTASSAGWGNGGNIRVGVRCFRNPDCFVHEFMHFFTGALDEYAGTFPDGVDNDGDGSIDECAENRTGRRCEGGADHGKPCQRCIGGTADGLRCFGNAGDCPGGACQTQCSGGTCDSVKCQASGDQCFMTCCAFGSATASELCYGGSSGDHDPDGDTAQTRCRNGDSCWETLGRQWPTVIKVPAGQPDPGPATSPTSVSFLTPSVLGRFVAIIDRSDSMEDENPSRIRLATSAAMDFVDLLANGTDFGLVSFAEEATKDFPDDPGLRALDSTADREDAKDAIDDLRGRTGNKTAIGSGLRAAKAALLEDGGEVTLNTAVLLVTDGINNRPEGNASGDLVAALDELAAEQIPVFVTCIGEARDSTQCSFIADRTAGRFVDSAAAENLFDTFVEFAAAAQGEEVAALRLNEPISEGDLSAAFPVLIEPEVESARFVATWTQFDTNLELRLFRPDGTQVPESSFVAASQGGFYRIDAPTPGIWTMRVFGDQVAAGETYSLRAIVAGSTLHAFGGLGTPMVQWPDGFSLGARPSNGRSLVGCRVSVTVEKPDGTVEELLLPDEDPNGELAPDGFHQLEYRNLTAGDGIYTFTTHVQCRGARMVPDPHIGEELDDVPGVPDFDRVIRFSGTASGVPDNLPPTANICMDVRAECAGQTTAVTLDGLCSFDPEEEALSFAWSSSTCQFSAPTDGMPTANCPLGRNQVRLSVTDAGGAESEPDDGLVVIADTTPPLVRCSTEQSSLWPPNGDLQNVGLRATAEDVCAGALPVAVQVFSNENDREPTGAGVGAPDASEIANATLRLRSERRGDSDGRVYLVVVDSTDPSGNRAVECCTVVVPHSRKTSDLHAVEAKAAAAAQFCRTNAGQTPAGFSLIGAGPAEGPKQ